MNNYNKALPTAKVTQAPTSYSTKEVLHIRQRKVLHVVDTGCMICWSVMHQPVAI
jgi:hypothetical protein